MLWPAAGSRLNARFAVIGGDIWDLSLDPPIPRRAETVKRELANVRVQETPDGPARPVLDLWMKWADRRTYRAAVFDPAQAPRTGVPSPLAGEQDFNLWPGFALKPSTAGSCDRFRDHLLHVVCAGNAELFAWVEMWLAHIVQAPDRLAGTALALKGPQGAGKSVVGEVMRAILGAPLHVSLSKPELITGRFNAQHVGKLLLQAEEAFWAGDKAAAGALKHMITSDRALIERKGVDPVDLPNYARVLVTSNSGWIVPAGLGERRFAVLQVTGDRRHDHRYWKALRAEMFDQGGCARFLDHLLNHVVVNWETISRPPATAALVEQQLEALSPEDQWLYSILQGGRLPGDWRGTGVAGCEELARDFGAGTDVRRYRRARSAGTRLGQYLKDGPLAGRVQRRRIGPREGRQWVYFFPSLAECRELFEKHLGGRPDWEDLPEWEPAETFVGTVGEEATGSPLDAEPENPEPAWGAATSETEPVAPCPTCPTSEGISNSPRETVWELEKKVGQVGHVGHGLRNQQLTCPTFFFGVLPRLDTKGNSAPTLPNALSSAPSSDFFAPPVRDARDGWGSLTP